MIDNLKCGIDGIEFILAKSELNNVKLGKILIDNRTVGAVTEQERYYVLSVCLPMLLSDSNIEPVTHDIMIGSNIKNQIKEIVQNKLGVSLCKLNPKSIEVNCTCRSDTVKPSNILKLLLYSYLDTKKQTLAYVLRDENWNEIISGMKSYTIANRYTLKCYDKSMQQKQQGRAIEDNYVRIEIILLRRLINQIYKKNDTLDVILSNIEPLIKEFQHIYEDDILKRVKKYCTEVKKLLFDELMGSNKPIDTISKYYTKTADRRIIEKALDLYYEKSNKQNKTKVIIGMMEKGGYKYPVGVIKTLSEIRKILSYKNIF